MKFFPLIWRNLLRRKFRTIFTVLSIVFSFVVFGYLAAVNKAFQMGVDLTGLDRLMVIHKVSIIQPLPFSYLGRIESIPGVVGVAHASWFGGIYQDPKNFFPQMAVDPERYLGIYPEFVLPEDQRKAWLADRTGAVAGRAIAKKFGWKVGDRIPIQGTFNRKKDGSSLWEFTLDGIYDGKEKGTDTTQFLFHYAYLDEARAVESGLVGWYIIRISEPARATEIANRIDQTFENSSAETKTTTEKAVAQSFANQVGDVRMIVISIGSVVFVSLLIVTAITMAQAVRERTNELAVLKTLGFTDAHVLGLVLGESLLLVFLGGSLGIGIVWLLINGLGDPTGGMLPIFYLPASDAVLGLLMAAVLAVASGVLPAFRAMRLTIVDALGRR